jgi:hypothetical protein
LICFSCYFQLILKYDFNQTIDNLPLKLKVIELVYCKFQKKIEEKLIDIIPAKCEIEIINRYDSSEM